MKIILIYFIKLSKYIKYLNKSCDKISIQMNGFIKGEKHGVVITAEKVRCVRSVEYLTMK